MTGPKFTNAVTVALIQRALIKRKQQLEREKRSKEVKHDSKSDSV